MNRPRPRLAPAVLLSLAVALCCLSHSADAEAERQLPDLSVELHSHLFMKPALGWMFNGSFDGPLQADSWQDRLSSKVNAETLNRSGIGIAVVALLAHPLFSADMRDSVRRQIALTEAFVRDNPEWAIAKSAQEARRLLLSGRRVLVLSLEGASGVLESEEDLREFIDEKGIRIVTELHLVDDRYGGAATLSGFQYVSNPVSLVDQLLDRQCTDGVEQNRRGLTPMGRRLAVELIKRGVWIDLSHASDAALQTLAALQEAAKHPLLFSHTPLRRYRKNERSLSDAMLQRVGASGGIVGLLPSEDSYDDIDVPRRFCPEGCEIERCQGSVHAFAKMYSETAALVGGDAVMLGSDFNGGMRHLAPACGTGGPLDADTGMLHIGHSAPLWAALRKLKAPVPPLSQTLSRFLATWSRVTPRDLTPQLGGELPSLPSRAEAQGPSLATQAGVGLSGAEGAGAPALLMRFDIRLRKDSGIALDAEPTFYLAHANAEVHKALDNDAVPFVDLRLAPAGVQAHHWDNRVSAEALPFRIRRHLALDQQLTAQLAALGGVARTTPGILKKPGHYNLFLELSLDGLGYKTVRHDSERADLHGFYLAGGNLQLGASLVPLEGLLLVPYAMVGSDITFLTSPSAERVAYQSNISAHVGLRAGSSDRRFTQFFEVSYFANRERHVESLLLDTPQLRGGIVVGF